MTYTREDVTKVMDELDRRIKMDVEDGTIPNNWRHIREEIVTRMQGVYGTIMAVVPNRNWQDVVWWLDDEMEKRYDWYRKERQYDY